MRVRPISLNTYRGPRMAPAVLLGFTIPLIYTNDVFSCIYDYFEAKITIESASSCLFTFCSQRSLSKQELLNAIGL